MGLLVDGSSPEQYVLMFFFVFMKRFTAKLLLSVYNIESYGT